MLHVVVGVLLFTPRLRQDSPYYYEHLRSAYFDHDLCFHDERPFTRPERGGRMAMFVAGPNEQGRPRVGGPNNTFDVGTTVLEVPFFLAGHAAALVARALGRSGPVDGYGAPYVRAMCLGFLAVGLAGALLVYHVARDTAAPGHDASSDALWATVLAVWGSFMPAYFYEDTLLSHLPTFAASALLLWVLTRARAEIDGARGWRLVFLSGAAFAALVLTRRQCLLMAVLFGVLAPPLWRRGGLGALARGAALASAGFVIAIFPELCVWRVEHGAFLANPGMVPLRSRPLLGLVLWSDHGGLFSHSPLLLLGAAGLLLLAWRDRLWGSLLLLACSLQVLINALRVEWWPGIGWGNRRSDSLVPIFALGIAVLLARLRHGPRRALLAIGALLLLWNLAAIPQFYPSASIRDKGSHFASFAAHRAPGRARVRWPFPPLARLPSLIAEDVAIVRANADALRATPASLATLLLTVLGAAAVVTLAVHPRARRLGRLVPLAPVVGGPLLGLVVLLIGSHERSVLALYYDPGEPVELLRIGADRPFVGGKEALPLVAGDPRTFRLKATCAASAIEAVVGLADEVCVTLDGHRELRISGAAGRAIAFPSRAAHVRLPLAADTPVTEITVDGCEAAPASLYGLALATGEDL